MAYVDGFLLAVPKDKIEEYKAFSTKFGAVWREYGALSYIECVADDVPYGEVTSFPRAVQAKDDETVIFAWITYNSRAHRDEVNKKVMEDSRLKTHMEGMPFDGKRMIYGGFEVVVDV